MTILRIFARTKKHNRSLGSIAIERQIGVFAQDVESVIPEAVKPAPFDTENGISKSGDNYLTVQYEKIVPLLIESIKEQQSMIEDLQGQINELKSIR